MAANGIELETVSCQYIGFFVCTATKVEDTGQEFYWQDHYVNKAAGFFPVRSQLFHFLTCLCRNDEDLTRSLHYVGLRSTVTCCASFHVSRCSPCFL